jgi:hypothetical protein
MSSCYIASSGGRFRMPRANLTILVEILTMPALKKEKEIFSRETVEVKWERTETLGVNMIKAICRHV